MARKEKLTQYKVWLVDENLGYTTVEAKNVNEAARIALNHLHLAEWDDVNDDIIYVSSVWRVTETDDEVEEARFQRNLAPKKQSGQ